MINAGRQFIEHPSTIPLEYRIKDISSVNRKKRLPKTQAFAVKHTQTNLCGLRFNTNNYIKPKQWLRVHIPLKNQAFEADAQVLCCKPNLNADHSTQRYSVSVIFCNAKTAFSARMAEQVCYIEAYKHHVKEKEGRELSSDQAAIEWIAKHADQFPSLH